LKFGAGKVRVKEERRGEERRGEEYPTCNKKKESYWIGYILHRQCLLKHAIKESKGKDRSDGKTKEKT
jgi:hypothetical protein